MNIPGDIELLKVNVAEVPAPLCSAVDNGKKAEKTYLFTAQRTGGGRELPAYYLCYFLFVDLLGVKNHGQLEGDTSISGTVA